MKKLLILPIILLLNLFGADGFSSKNDAQDAFSSTINLSANSLLKKGLEPFSLAKEEKSFSNDMQTPKAPPTKTESPKKEPQTTTTTLLSTIDTVQTEREMAIQYWDKEAKKSKADEVDESGMVDEFVVFG